MNRKEQDKRCVLEYIQAKNEPVISVAEVMDLSGVDSLRVFTILYELCLEGLLEVHQSSPWGAPESYIIKKNPLNQI